MCGYNFFWVHGKKKHVGKGCLVKVIGMMNLGDEVIIT